MGSSGQAQSPRGAAASNGVRALSLLNHLSLPRLAGKMSAQCVRVRMKLEEIAIGNNLTGVEPTLVVSVVAVVPIANSSIRPCSMKITWSATLRVDFPSCPLFLQIKMPIPFYPRTVSSTQEIAGVDPSDGTFSSNHLHG
jgi:hypothetical protein